MSDQSDVVQAQAQQRELAKRATLEEMLGKTPARDEFTLPIGPGNDARSYLFVAIGSRRYDELVTKNPPTDEQRVRGAVYNVNTFGPALLAEVCQEPQLSSDQWTQIWRSKEWSTGDLSQLFSRALELCIQGLDATPIAAG